jgi:hypothetical protein
MCAAFAGALDLQFISAPFAVDIDFDFSIVGNAGFQDLVFQGCQISPMGLAKRAASLPPGIKSAAKCGGRFST